MSPEQKEFESAAGDVITSIRHALGQLQQAETQLSRMPRLAPSDDAATQIQMLNIPLVMAQQAVNSVGHYAALHLTRIMKETIPNG